MLLRRRVPGIASIVLIIAGDLDRKTVGQRHVDRGARQLLVVAAIAHFGIAADRLPGLAHDDADRAARGVAPEQRSLRSAQHLDALDIEQRQVVGILSAQIDVIDIGADRRVEGRNRLCIPQTTKKISVRRADAGVVDRDQIGHELPELQRVRHALRLQLFRRKCRHRDRHVLHALLATLCRHDDIADAFVRVVRRRLREGGRRQHKSERRDAAFQMDIRHDRPP